MDRDRFELGPLLIHWVFVDKCLATPWPTASWPGRLYSNAEQWKLLTPRGEGERKPGRFNRSTYLSTRSGEAQHTLLDLRGNIPTRSTDSIDRAQQHERLGCHQSDRCTERRRLTKTHARPQSTLRARTRHRNRGRPNQMTRMRPRILVRTPTRQPEAGCGGISRQRPQTHAARTSRWC